VLENLTRVTTSDQIIALQDLVPGTKMDSSLVEYILDLAKRRDTTRPALAFRLVAPWALTQAAQASAVLHGAISSFPTM